MTPRPPPLSWLWNGLTVALLGGAFVVHREATTDVDAHTRAMAAAVARSERRAITTSWERATTAAVETAPRWIRALAPSPLAGAEVASGAADGTIRFHDGRSGEVVRSWPAHHPRAVTALAWADESVVSGDAGGGVVVTDVATGEVRWSRRDLQDVVAVGVAPERDQVVAVDRDGRRERLSFATGAPLGSAGASPYTILAFDDDLSDGAVAWASVGGNLRAWDAWTDQRVGQARVDATRRIDALAVDAPRRRAAVARRDGVLALWDTGDGTLLAEWTAETPVTCLAFSPDGSMVVVGGVDGVVRRKDAATGRGLGAMKAAGDQLATLRFSRDGAVLYAGGRRGVLHVFARERP